MQRMVLRIVALSAVHPLLESAELDGSDKWFQAHVENNEPSAQQHYERDAKHIEGRMFRTDNFLCPSLVLSLHRIQGQELT